MSDRVMVHSLKGSEERKRPQGVARTVAKELDPDWQGEGVLTLKADGVVLSPGAKIPEDVMILEVIEYVPEPVENTEPSSGETKP